MPASRYGGTSRPRPPPMSKTPPVTLPAVSAGVEQRVTADAKVACGPAVTVLGNADRPDAARAAASGPQLGCTPIRAAEMVPPLDPVKSDAVAFTVQPSVLPRKSETTTWFRAPVTSCGVPLIVMLDSVICAPAWLASSGPGLTVVVVPWLVLQVPPVEPFESAMQLLDSAEKAASADRLSGVDSLTSMPAVVPSLT